AFLPSLSKKCPISSKLRLDIQSKLAENRAAHKTDEYTQDGSKNSSCGQKTRKTDIIRGGSKRPHPHAITIPRYLLRLCRDLSLPPGSQRLKDSSNCLFTINRLAAISVCQTFQHARSDVDQSRFLSLQKLDPFGLCLKRIPNSITQVGPLFRPRPLPPSM
ncbi:MAG: hypothetical protein AAGC95_11480, partial [Pseudomonadota bacterium]